MNELKFLENKKQASFEGKENIVKWKIHVHA